MSSKLRIGSSIDVHILKKSDVPKVYLGDVLIKAPYLLAANTNGDVILHSISEAIIGALGRGDLGSNFGDSKKQIQDQKLTSKKILNSVLERLKSEGKIVNIDVTVVCDEIYLNEYRNEIQDNLTKLTNCKNVNVKFTRSEEKAFSKMIGITTLLLELN